MVLFDLAAAYVGFHYQSLPLRPSFAAGLVFGVVQLVRYVVFGESAVVGLIIGIVGGLWVMCCFEALYGNPSPQEPSTTTVDAPDEPPAI